jgi:hypothetical protein
MWFAFEVRAVICSQRDRETKSEMRASIRTLSMNAKHQSEKDEQSDDTGGRTVHYHCKKEEK